MSTDEECTSSGFTDNKTGEALRIGTGRPGGEKIAASNGGVQNLGSNLRGVCLPELGNLELLILFVDNRRHGALMSHRPDQRGPLCKGCELPEGRTRDRDAYSVYTPPGRMADTSASSCPFPHPLDLHHLPCSDP